MFTFGIAFHFFIAGNRWVTLNLVCGLK